MHFAVVLSSYEWTSCLICVGMSIYTWYLVWMLKG